MENYTDQVLTNMSQSMQNSDDSFLASKLLPRVAVARNSGVFPKWGNEAMIIQSDLRRTGRSLTREIGITRSTGTWGPLTEKALKYFLSRDEARMYSTPLESQTQALNVLNQQMLLAEEYQAAQTLTSTTIITNNVTLTSGSQFNDGASDPIKTIVTGIRAVEDASMVTPNTVVFSRKAWNALLEHPSVVDRFKYVQASIIGKAEIMSILAPHGIENIEIARARGTLVDTENPSGAGSLIDLWGRDVLITHVTPRPALNTINGGYTLYIEGEKFVDRWDVKDPIGEYIRQRDYYDQVLFSTNVYYLIKNAVAA